MLPHRAWVDMGAMAMKGAPYSPKLQHYLSLTIRLFSVISRTLIVCVGGGVLTHCRGAVGVFYSSSRLGNLWTLTHWHTSVGWQARTYTHQAVSKTSQDRWMIRMDGGRESGNTLFSARFDNVDDNNWNYFYLIIMVVQCCFISSK